AEPGWQIASAKHGGSGVVLRYAVPDKVALGETVTVRLRLSGVTAADGATVEVRDPALGTTLAAFTLASGEQRALELPFTARVDGPQPGGCFHAASCAAGCCRGARRTTGSAAVAMRSAK